MEDMEDEVEEGEGGADRGPGIGRRVILPSPHVGSERAMRAAFVDAMAINGCFMKPHLFVTATSNPEIYRELLATNILL